MIFISVCMKCLNVPATMGAVQNTMHNSEQTAWCHCASLSLRDKQLAHSSKFRVSCLSHELRTCHARALQWKRMEGVNEKSELGLVGEQASSAGELFLLLTI